MRETDGREIELQPHNLQAERATLGGVLIDPDALMRIREIVKPFDFYLGKHALVYGAYVTAVDGGNEAPSYVEICDILDRQGKLEEVGGAAFITSLINQTPTALNVQHYAKIIAETGYLRRVIAAAQKIAQVGYSYDEESIETKQEQIERIVFDLAPIRAGEGLQHIRITASEVYDEMDRRQRGQIPPGIKTGFHTLDKLTSGLQKSDFIVVAARPSMGKTSLMLDIGRNAAKLHYKNVALFSLEMSRAQMIQRLIASQTGISTNTLRAGKLNDGDWPMFVDCIGDLGNTGIYIDDQGNQSASQMRAKLRRLLARVDIDLVIIDYLQCMRTDRYISDLYTKTSELSKACKALAKEFDIPLVVGCQLNRNCESRNDKRPVLSDLRDSGSIEEDADIVAFIYRDEYYDSATESPHIAEINIAKHRNGPTGLFPLFFKKPEATFHNLELHGVEL